jgi:hypothetical protein
MKRKIKPTPARSPALSPNPEPQPKPYVPTEHERAAAERVTDRTKRHPPSPRFKVDYSGSDAKVTGDHPDPACNFILLTDAMGTGNVRFAEGLLHQIVNLSRSGKELKASELNFLLATIQEIRPRDPTEALLATQMAAIHNATIVAARRLNHTETIDQQDSCSNMLNKLARTFATQVEALKKYRATGEQSIRVQHVTVNDGGQAIVNTAQTGGGRTIENTNQSHAPSRLDECGPALLGHEQALPMPLPSTCCEGAVGVSDARSTSGGANWEGQRRVAARLDDE